MSCLVDLEDIVTRHTTSTLHTQRHLLNLRPEASVMVLSLCTSFNHLLLLKDRLQVQARNLVVVELDPWGILYNE